MRTAIFPYDSKKLFHVTFGLKSGNYTLTASKDGYTPMSFNVIVLPETDKGGQDATMSPIMAAEEYRVVLRWGAVPEDLDSHYNALSADGDEEHVYYSEMDSANAHLDVDDRDSYGPETITISGFENLKNGFTYSVHDYTNSDYDDSRELSHPVPRYSCMYPENLSEPIMSRQDVSVRYGMYFRLMQMEKHGFEHV